MIPLYFSKQFRNFRKYVLSMTDYFDFLSKSIFYWGKIQLHITINVLTYILI